MANGGWLDGGEMLAAELQRQRTDTADEENLTIAMGIGLKRRSSFRVYFLDEPGNLHSSKH